MDREQLAERRALKAAYLAQAQAVRATRAAVRSTGLAAFLGRVTGVSFVIGKLHRHRDVKTFKAFAAKRQEMNSCQRQATLRLQAQQEVETLDTARQLKGMAKVEARERQALEVKRVREQRVLSRRGHDHMPALKLDLKPRGRRASVFRAQNRYSRRPSEAERVTPRRPKGVQREGERINLRRSMKEALARQEPWPTLVDLAGDFARASGGEGNVGDGTSEGEAPKVRVSRAERKSERRRKREDDFEKEK
jgi:hypothetical protein